MYAPAASWTLVASARRTQRPSSNEPPVPAGNVIVATVTPPTRAVVHISGTAGPPACGVTVNAPASSVTGPLNVTAKLRTIDRWADPSSICTAVAAGSFSGSVATSPVPPAASVAGTVTVRPA